MEDGWIGRVVDPRRSGSGWMKESGLLVKEITVSERLYSQYLISDGYV